MMKKLALLAMMVFGSTSIASAGSFSSQRRYEGRDPQRASINVRDHRSNQSWNETPAVLCNDANVSGYYVGPAGNVRLVQRGNQIFGTFDKGGQMTGVIENGKITYTWSGDGYHGKGYWYVTGNGQLTGMWGANQSSTSGGNWNLTLA